jgi:hypothetical protein
MKIEQDKAEFKPITITFETEEEAKDFIWGIDNAFSEGPTPAGTKSIFIRISNEFSNRKLV